MDSNALNYPQFFVAFARYKNNVVVFLGTVVLDELALCYSLSNANVCYFVDFKYSHFELWCCYHIFCVVCRAVTRDCDEF